MSTPSALQRLEAFLASKQPGFETSHALADEARKLSIAYTEGAPIPTHAASSIAYLAHFGPRAIAAVTHAARTWPRIPKHVVDVGAGSGASALALLALGVERVTLVERDTDALKLARMVLHPVHTRVRFVEGDITGAPVVDADGVLSSFSFGELPGTPREAFAALERLAPKADNFVLVDAGDHPRARRLQMLRDALVVEGRPIAGPCAHTDPCPALLRSRDWCHDRIDKHLPERLARFAMTVGRDAERMSLSWLVVAERTHADAIIVIGEPVKDKGRVRVPVCGPGNVRFLQALKRHKDAHRALMDLERGTRLPPVLAARTTTDVQGTLHVEDPKALGPA